MALVTKDRDWHGRFLPGHAPARIFHRTCNVQGCERKHFGKGYCATHYYRAYHGYYKNMEAPIGSLPTYVLGRTKPGFEPTQHPTLKDIYWAAGIIEGEGSFQHDTIAVYQKDKWILEKLKLLFGGIIDLRHKTGYGNGVYCWRIHGSRGRGLMMTIFALLSPWRKNLIKKGLKHALS